MFLIFLKGFWKKLDGWKIRRLGYLTVRRLEGSMDFVVSPVSRNFWIDLIAAGTRRGVCNCIQATTPSRVPAEGRPGPSFQNG